VVTLRSGFGVAIAETPSACRREITSLQLADSANAPCTRTTVNFWDMISLFEFDDDLDLDGRVGIAQTMPGPDGSDWPCECYPEPRG
jgi:hypothetical protein